MAASDPERITPPYIPWKTFENFMERIKGQVLPTHIDRSVLPKTMAGTLQRQLVSALRFLRLIDASNAVTENMRKLYKEWGSGKHDEFTQIFFEAYHDICKGLDLDSGTATQLFERFKVAGGVDGQVRQKSVRFFLSGMQAMGTTFSPHFLTRGASSDKPSKPKRTAKATGESGEPRKKTEKAKRPRPTHETKRHSAAGSISFDIPLGPSQAIHIECSDRLTEADRVMIDAVLKAYIARQGNK